MLGCDTEVPDAGDVTSVFELVLRLAQVHGRTLERSYCVR